MNAPDTQTKSHNNPPPDAMQAMRRISRRTALRTGSALAPMVLTLHPRPASAGGGSYTYNLDYTLDTWEKEFVFKNNEPANPNVITREGTPGKRTYRNEYGKQIYRPEDLP